MEDEHDPVSNLGSVFTATLSLMQKVPQVSMPPFVGVRKPGFQSRECPSIILRCAFFKNLAMPSVLEACAVHQAFIEC